MKIPILYIPRTKFKKYLHIETRLKAKNVVIPLGCDCHPAYVLDTLSIREQSLPFDWLNTDPIKGIQFVTKVMQSSFTTFLEGLYRNERGHIVSKAFPFAEFMHEKQLMESKTDQEKFQRRIKRYQGITQNKQIDYLYNLPSEDLVNRETVAAFYASVAEFTEMIKAEDHLYIYLRYDEHIGEHKEWCDALLLNLNSLEKVTTARYVRKLKAYGIWGTPKEYLSLLNNLGITYKKLFPKVYVK